MNEHTSRSPKSIYSGIVRGTAWVLAMRWGMRGIGLVNTIICARLLLPEDFGIFAMAAMTMGLLEVFFEMGVDLYLIRSSRLTREDWDTAWTFRILQGFCLAAVLVAVAPLAARYFNETRVVEVVNWMAVAAVVRGLQNIGVVRFRKDLDFAAEFRFGIYGRWAVFCITIPAAIILHNYWAIVIGQVAGAFLQTFLSYRMHSFRPRLSLSRARPVFAFFMPVVLLSAADFVYDRIDAFVVGGISDSARLGPYTVASSISLMIGAEWASSMNRALVPSYTKIIEDHELFRPAYLHAIRAVGILSFALCVGLSSVAHDFVLVVLGARWEGAIPLVEWLAFFALARAIGSSIGPSLLLVPGGEWRAMVLSWIRLAYMVPTVAAAGVLWGVQAVAVAATLTNFIFVPLLIHQLVRVLPITTRQIVGALWPPAVAASAMAIVVRLVELPDEPPAVGLLIDVVVGAVAYALILILLWHLMGRPNGPERALLEFLLAFARRPPSDRR